MIPCIFDITHSPRHLQHNKLCSGAVKTQYCALCVKSLKSGTLMYFFYAESFKKGTQPDWPLGVGWGCEVSCGGHHRPRGKTTTGSALDGAVFDIAQNTGLSSTQYEQIPIILGVWPFWLTPFFFRSITFWRAYG